MKIIQECKLLLVLSSFLFTTSAYSAIPSEAKNKASEPIESITVTGEGKVFYRQLMNLAEDELFDLYNELTEDKDFKVKCSNKNRHGFTRIKQRKCESAFQSRIKYENMQVARKSGSSRTGTLSNGTWMNRVGPSAKSYAEMKELRKKQVEDIVQKIMDNPALEQKFRKLLQTRESYKNAD